MRSRFLFTLTLLFCGIAGAQAATAPAWRLYTGGQTYVKVWRALPAEVQKELHELTGGKGALRRPIGMAAVDLNSDDSPELIAYLPRDYNLYTDDYEGDPYFIFATNREGELQQLTSFRAFGVLLADSHTEGVRDLMVFTDNDSGEYALLKWDHGQNEFVARSGGVYDPRTQAPEPGQ